MSATETPARAETTQVLPGVACGARRREPVPVTSPRRGGAGAQPRVSVPTSDATLLRRRLVALAGLVLLLTLLTVAVGRVGAEAELADRVAGHTVLAPGDTLWDVAVSSAPDGVDPREQLAAIRALNGFDGASVDAWTVVLLPAR